MKPGRELVQRNCEKAYNATFSKSRSLALDSKIKNADFYFHQYSIQLNHLNNVISKQKRNEKSNIESVVEKLRWQMPPQKYLSHLKQKNKHFYQKVQLASIVHLQFQKSQMREPIILFSLSLNFALWLTIEAIAFVQVLIALNYQAR